MSSVKVGMREFRKRLASYLLSTQETIAITRRGSTVGYFIPARCARSQAERVALVKAASRLYELLASEGIIEDENAPAVRGMHRERRRG
jgi:hypothetical protein